MFRPSGGVRVLVDQAVEDSFSTGLLCVDVGHGAADTVAFAVGNVLGDALVRPGGVVVRLVSGQDGMQVLLAEDQHAVRERAAQGAGQALADRVHPRRLHGGAHDPGTGGLEDGTSGLTPASDDELTNAKNTMALRHGVTSRSAGRTND